RTGRLLAAGIGAGGRDRPGPAGGGHRRARLQLTHATSMPDVQRYRRLRPTGPGAGAWGRDLTPAASPPTSTPTWGTVDAYRDPWQDGREPATQGQFRTPLAAAGAPPGAGAMSRGHR